MLLALLLLAAGCASVTAKLSTALPDEELGWPPTFLLYVAKLLASLSAASDLVGVACLPALEAEHSCFGEPKSANLSPAAKPA